MSKTRLSLRRYAELVALFLFARRDIAAIEKPPPIHPSKANPANPAQLLFNYA
jgi:hypothetical protein